MKCRSLLKSTWLPLLFATVACLVAKAAPAENRPWYHTLRPGVTRAEIQHRSGLTLPSGSKVEVAAGTLGRFEFEFRDDVLHRALHYDPALPHGGGDVIYGAYRGPVVDDPAARRAFLKAGKYDEIPHFVGPQIRTRKYNGYCYEVDGQYIVFEPIAEMGTGYFANKPHRVLLVEGNGAEKILFHAKDHWSELRPPSLSSREAVRREEALRRLGTRAIGTQASDIFGQEDSRMGSGINYHLYYLPSALALVQVGGGRAQRVVIIFPGGEQHMSFEEWLSTRGAQR